MTDLIQYRSESLVQIRFHFSLKTMKMVKENLDRYSLIILGIIGCCSTIPAYGDGLASETLPPSIIGNMNVTLSIGSSPFLIDENHTGTQINFVLIDVDKQQPIPQVTLSVTAFSHDRPLFGHIFKSDNGNFLLNLYPAPSGNVTIDETGGLFSGLIGQHSGNYDVRGPAFNLGGLYKFKIEILTMGSYDNQVSKSYDAAISIPQTIHYQIYDNQYGKQNVTIIAYYDQINNFRYESDKKLMSFVMPFDWSVENLKNVSVVHQEVKIPKSFGNFIVTGYDSYVNGIKLSDKAISIDDYSSEDRIIHLILYKQELSQIAAQQHVSNSEMHYTLAPSNKTNFPIIQYTTNAQYKVALSWDPPKILPGATTKFSFKVLDPYLVNQTVDSIHYDFTIIEGKNGVISQRSGNTNNNGSMNTIYVHFPSNYTGAITIAFENLNANSFASSEFSGVVTVPSSVPEFPQLSSVLFAMIIFVVFISRINRFKKTSYYI